MDQVVADTPVRVSCQLYILHLTTGMSYWPLSETKSDFLTSFHQSAVPDVSHSVTIWSNKLGPNTGASDLGSVFVHFSLTIQNEQKTDFKKSQIIPIWCQYGEGQI